MEWEGHHGCLDGARSNHPACQHQVGWQRGGARAERAGGGALLPAVTGEPAQPGVKRGCQTDSVRIKLPPRHLPISAPARGNKKAWAHGLQSGLPKAWGSECPPAPYNRQLLLGFSGTMRLTSPAVNCRPKTPVAEATALNIPWWVGETGCRQWPTTLGDALEKQEPESCSFCAPLIVPVLKV